MGQSDRRPRTGERRERTSLYQEVTDRIIAELEQDRVPWVRPWGQAKAGLALPKNAATRRRYSGINILILWGAVIEKGFPSQHWLTFRQALDLGGNVRKGEHGTTVFYADRFIPKAEIQRAARDGDEPDGVPFLKRFTVFNVAQCDGLPEEVVTSAPVAPDWEIVGEAEALIAATGADFRTGGERAFYAVLPDYVQVPPQPAFFEPINYYSVGFHELGHWTGHPSRLARDLLDRLAPDEELAPDPRHRLHDQHPLATQSPRSETAASHSEGVKIRRRSPLKRGQICTPKHTLWAANHHPIAFGEVTGARGTGLSRQDMRHLVPGIDRESPPRSHHDLLVAGAQASLREAADRKRLELHTDIAQARIRRSLHRVADGLDRAAAPDPQLNDRASQIRAIANDREMSAETMVDKGTRRSATDSKPTLANKEQRYEELEKQLKQRDEARRRSRTRGRDDGGRDR